MTLIDLTTSFTGDDLLAACESLGVRRPLGLVESIGRDRSAQPPPRPGPVRPAVPVSDDIAAALATLASPEAIAVIDRDVRGIRATTYVATRGPWAAVHRIDGERHTLESLDGEDAPAALLAATGLDAAPPPVLSWSFETGKSGAITTTRAPEQVLDLTRGAFDRMAELVAEGDLVRGAAALEADGAEARFATAVTEATRADRVHVLGLRSIGRRYEGCELSWVGDADRWLVPLPARAGDTGAVHRHLAGPPHVRVLIEPVQGAALIAELSIIFA